MPTYKALAALLVLLLLAGCGERGAVQPEASELAAGDYPRGPHNGRLLEDQGFALELAIFETGVPPEFRAWATREGEPVPPEAVDLEVRLDRLGNVVDVIGFQPQADFLRGDSVIYEPHSFAVTVEARHGGQTHRWQYESFEGRTTLAPEMTEALGIGTEIAGPAVLSQTLQVPGIIRPQPEQLRQVRARFEGEVLAVAAELGEAVAQGATLLSIESNESLNAYTVSSPIDGIVVGRYANPGEQTGGRVLLELMAPGPVRAELAIPAGQRSELGVGDPVTLRSPLGGGVWEGRIDRLGLTVNAVQAVPAWVVLGDAEGGPLPGSFVDATVTTGEFEVPLAVKRSGLQSFRDFTVVYAKVGDTYEVRMLELGRQDGEWVEVLGGLEPGTEYVSTNSFVLKADVEKSGASHDH